MDKKIKDEAEEIIKQIPPHLVKKIGDVYFVKGLPKVPTVESTASLRNDLREAISKTLK